MFKSNLAQWGLTTHLRVLCVALPGILLSNCSQPDALNDNDLKIETKPGEIPVRLSSLQAKAAKAVEDFARERSAVEDAKGFANKAMSKVLFDPASATFTDIRKGKDGSVCGKVNAKNRYGAYVGYKDFVISKAGDVEISSTNDGLSTELYTGFAVAYSQWCASKQENADYALSIAPAPSIIESKPYQEPDGVLDAPPPEESEDPIPTT